MRVLLAPLMLLCSAAPLAAQGFEYRPSAEPLYYEGLNEYRMYHIRAGDTVGAPVSDFSIERREWRESASGFTGIIHQLTLNWRRASEIDSFAITPLGRVLSINRDTALPRGRYDLLLRLPDTGASVEVGMSWTDTLTFGGHDGPIGQRYWIARSYRATRLLDTLGASALEVVAEGEVRYRDGYWRDSTAGMYLWLDVRGPVTEAYYLDPARGQLLARRWSMDLRGVGGLPEAPADTIPAGLVSTDDTHIISAERYAELGRALPGSDTTYTVSGGVQLLHTAEFEDSVVRSGMVRNDGLVGTGEARFVGGHPTRYDALWTDSRDSVVRHRIRVEHDSLYMSSLRMAGTETVTYPVPDGAWTIAEHRMDEYLVPALLDMPDDGSLVALDIYRPSADVWDSTLVRMRPAGELVLAALQSAGEDYPTYLVFSREGDLLYVETGGPHGVARIPRMGTPEWAQVQQALDALEHAVLDEPEPALLGT